VSSVKIRGGLANQEKQIGRGKQSERYEAEQLWDALRAGHVRVKGGWRIYSSGPGILTNQIVSNLLVLNYCVDGQHIVSPAELQDVVLK
jgi:cellobiose phosphorylase